MYPYFNVKFCTNSTPKSRLHGLFLCIYTGDLELKPYRWKVSSSILITFITVTAANIKSRVNADKITSHFANYSLTVIMTDTQQKKYIVINNYCDLFASFEKNDSTTLHKLPQ